LEYQEKPAKRPRRRFSDEFNHETVEIVHGSDKSIARFARELGIYDSTLGNWVKQDEIDRGVRVGVTSADREEVTEVRRENARLRTGV
jgi:transposase